MYVESGRLSAERKLIQIILMLFPFVHYTLSQFTELYDINEYCTVIATWLDASQRSRNSIGMNMSDEVLKTGYRAA